MVALYPGWERIFREKASGGRWDRPELHRLLDQLRKGDVLVVWKLDRLSRSLRDVLTIMEQLAEANAGFRSLTEAIDTETPLASSVARHSRTTRVDILPIGTPPICGSMCFLSSHRYKSTVRGRSPARCVIQVAA